MNIRGPAPVFDSGIVSAYNKHGSFTYAGVCSADVWRPLSIDCQSFPDVQLLRWGSFLGTVWIFAPFFTSAEVVLRQRYPGIGEK